MSINVAKQVLSVTTEEEFQKVLEKDKIAHPAKFAQKLASGEFDRQRIALGIVKSVKAEPEVKEEPKEEKKKK